MSFNDCKISESEIQTTGVQSQPDTLTGSAADNKMVFDALPTLVIQKLNSLIDQMQQQAAAGQVGVTPFDGMTAQTLQDALEQIQADIGGNYGGADGAGKVGYTPSEGVDASNVQAAIEAVQANLTAYIAKIKAATGAAEVGNAPIAGMTATNVQQALEELRKNIDNIVSGIIPGGSITSDMLQDGAVTEAKLSSDVAAKLAVLGGATTPQAALAALGAGVRPNLLDNAIFIGGGSQQGGGQLPVNQRGQMSYNTASGYTIDRWMHGTEPGEIELTADGVKFNGTEGMNLALAQLLDFSVSQDTVVTLSALYRGQIILDYWGATLSPSPVVESGWGLHAVTYTIPAGTNLANRLYSPTIKTNGTQISYFAAVKLELGSTQTLAYQDEDGAWQLLPQPESDYATQLLKCQRYYYRSDMRYSTRPGYGSRYLNIPVQFPVVMRIPPTVTVKSFAGTANMLSDWASALDADISVSANAPDVSKDGIGSFVAGADMNPNTVYGFCFEASADL